MHHTLQLYKAAADLLKLAKENGKNVKHILYSDKKYKFMNIKSLYALVTEALKHWAVLEILFEQSKILEQESGLNIWHVRILITELLFGTKDLGDGSENQLFETILKYENDLQNCLAREEVQTLLSNLPRPETKLKVRYIKVNTLKESVNSVIETLNNDGFELLETADSYEGYLEQVAELKPHSQLFLQDFHIPEILVFPPATELYYHELYKNGSFYFMDKSSCLAPLLLQPEPGSVVLDMCAAPGLKTIHLAGLAHSGKVFAVERDTNRFYSLQDMVKQSGAENVVTVNSDVTRLDPNQYSDVELILLDPSCSGSGMRERQPRLESESQSDDQNRLLRLAGFQLSLLRFALTRFPVAKRVVYSTCSVNIEENEEVVQAALNSAYHNFKLVSVSDLLPGWKNFGHEDFSFASKCVYSRPDTDFTNGFFVAVFERKNFDEDEVGQKASDPLGNISKVDDSEIVFNKNDFGIENNNKFNTIHKKDSKKRFGTHDDNFSMGSSENKRFKKEFKSSIEKRNVNNVASDACQAGSEIVLKPKDNSKTIKKRDARKKARMRLRLINKDKKLSSKNKTSKKPKVSINNNKTINNGNKDQNNQNIDKVPPTNESVKSKPVKVSKAKLRNKRAKILKLMLVKNSSNSSNKSPLLSSDPAVIIGSVSIKKPNKLHESVKQSKYSQLLENCSNFPNEESKENASVFSNDLDLRSDTTTEKKRKKHEAVTIENAIGIMTKTKPEKLNSIGTHGGGGSKKEKKHSSDHPDKQDDVNQSDEAIKEHSTPHKKHKKHKIDQNDITDSVKTKSNLYELNATENHNAGGGSKKKKKKKHSSDQPDKQDDVNQSDEVIEESTTPHKKHKKHKIDQNDITDSVMTKSNVYDLNATKNHDSDGVSKKKKKKQHSSDLHPNKQVDVNQPIEVFEESTTSHKKHKKKNKKSDKYDESLAILDNEDQE